MSDTKVFENTMPNGVKYEVHEVRGFSDRVELAIKVGGEVASILEIETKRTGNIVCKPAKARRVFIDMKGTTEVEIDDSPDVQDLLGPQAPRGAENAPDESDSE